MFHIDSYLSSINIFIPNNVNLSDIPEEASILIKNFIKLYEISDQDQIENTIYNTASLMVLLNIFEDIMVKDYDNKKVNADTLYFNILSQLFNSINELPKDIQYELEDLLVDNSIGMVYSKRRQVRIVKIPLISTDNTILIKCESKKKIEKEWTMIQEIKEKCGEFLIPYYNVLDCSKNLCIFCKEKSDSIIVMKESGNTLLHWIDDNYNTDHIYFGKLLRIFLGIIEALYCLNSNGYYHGDVKPQNILVSEKDGFFKVQLIDFEKSGKLEENKTTKGGTAEYKLYTESEVNKIDIQGMAIMIYVFVILRLPNFYEFKKYVKRILPDIDLKRRDIFPQILSLDPKLEKLGYFMGGDLLFNNNVIKMMSNYVSVLLGTSDKWFTKSDMELG